MDILRNTGLPLILLVLAGWAHATPVDAARDFMRAAEYADGQAFMDMLSQSLRQQLEASYSQLQSIYDQDPAMAGQIIEGYGISIAVDDLAWMTATDFASQLLRSISFPSLDDVTKEDASMNGRNASVTFTFYTGYTVTFQFVWEESSWKVTGSSLMDRMFR